MWFLFYEVPLIWLCLLFVGYNLLVKILLALCAASLTAWSTPMLCLNLQWNNCKMSAKWCKKNVSEKNMYVIVKYSDDQYLCLHIPVLTLACKPVADNEKKKNVTHARQWPNNDSGIMADFEKCRSEMNKDKITQQDTVGQQLKGNINSVLTWTMPC